MRTGSGAVVAHMAQANMLLRGQAQEALAVWEATGAHPNEPLLRQVLYAYGVPDLGIVPGGFRESLINTCAKADPENRLRLQLGFPVLVATIGVVEFVSDGLDRVVALLERKAGS